MPALIGALRATLSADTANFEQGMKRSQRVAQNTSTSIQRSLGAIAGTLKGAATGFLSALSIGVITQATKAALDYAGGLGEAASAAGVTTRELQLFRFAAAQNAVSTEQADKALSKLTISMSQALNGSKQARAAFAGVGVSLEDIQKKSKTEVIAQIAERMKETGGAAANASNGVKLFGRSFLQLAPLLDQGREGFNELARAADELGVVLSEEQIANADVTADKLDALVTVLKAQIAGVVADNAQSILALANSLASLTRAVVGFLNSNPQLALGLIGALAGARIGGAYGALAGGAVGAALGQGYANNQRDSNMDLKFRRAEFEKAQKNFRAIKGQQSGGRGGAVLDEIRGEFRKQIKLYGQAVASAKKPKAPAASSALNVPAVDIGGGGGSGKKAPRAKAVRDTSERDAVDALRDSYQFAQDQRRNELDILSAQRDLADDFVQRATISQQILDKNREGEKAEAAYQVALYEATKGKQGLSAEQSAALEAQREIVHGLETQAILVDQENRRAEEYERTEQLTADIRMELMRSQAGLAETAAERRKVELELLRIAYEERRRALESALARSKDADEQNRLRMQISALPAQQKAEQANVMKSTQGPWESYLDTLPNTAAKWEEALEGVRVRGFQALEDSIVGVISGTQSLADAFSQMTQQILADLVRIMIQKAITFAIGSAFGGGGASSSYSGGGFTDSFGAVPAFATGGSFMIGGNHGRDRNTLSLNGLPIAKVSHGERLSVSNDNPAASGMGGGFTFNNYARMSPDEARRTGRQAAAAYRTEMARAAREGY